jgi:hypothetical protein
MSAARLVTPRRWLGRLAPSLAAIVPILSLTSPSVADAATVYTLEGGLVGVIPGANFTAGQLRGDHCKMPNTCQNLPYTALPTAVSSTRARPACTRRSSAAIATC